MLRKPFNTRYEAKQGLKTSQFCVCRKNMTLFIWPWSIVMSSYLSTSFPLCLCQTRKWQKILNVLIPFSGMEIQLKCFDKALFKAAMILVEFLAKQNLTNSPNRCRPTSLIKIITASSIFPSYTF